MFKDRRVRHVLFMSSIVFTIFMILSPFEWSLIFKYTFTDDTKIESLTFDQDKITLIEENKPLLPVEEELSFFVNLDGKYYFLPNDIKPSEFCIGNECHKLQFYCRDDICLSHAYEAQFYLIMLMLILIFPLFIYGIVVFCEQKTSMA